MIKLKVGFSAAVQNKKLNVNLINFKYKSLGRNNVLSCYIKIAVKKGEDYQPKDTLRRRIFFIPS